MTELNYDKWIHLDAEGLAEGGILSTYQHLRGVLSHYVPEPAVIEEILDDEGASYTVRCLDQRYEIYSPVLPGDEGESWGRATYAFFKIVNDQLAKSEYRFFAINGGNDLGGMFLTEAECEAARKNLPRKEDWPYLPTAEHPWYGQPHS